MDWMNNPGTGKDSVSLTIAFTAFVFTLLFVTAALVASWVTHEPMYLSNLASIITAILTPSLGAYSLNKWSDLKFGNSDSDDKECSPGAPKKVLTEEDDNK